jgi:hypothetical protein
MDMRKYTGTVYLKAGDVKAGAIRVTIVDVLEGKYDKPDLLFHDGTKLSLNATNARTLVRAYGGSSEDLIDKEIELYLGSLRYDDKDNEAILVKPISPVIEKNTPPKPRKSGGDMNDSIPF